MVIVVTCLLGGGLWTSPALAQEATPAGCATTTEDENVDIAQQWVDVWDSGSVAGFEHLVSPDVVHHFGVRPDAVGLEAFQGQVAGFHEGFSDFAATTDDVIADGDLVAIRYTATGTHDGTFFGTAATGNEVTWTGISILRIACGTVAESWSEVSGVELWQQLGLLPAPAATGTPIPDAPAATPAPDCATTTEDDNAGIAQHYLDVWNTHDTSQFEALASPDVLHHWGQGPDTIGTAALAKSTAAFG
jgi:predicted ester cyclase